jgi:hypothetical protein
MGLQRGGLSEAGTRVGVMLEECQTALWVSRREAASPGPGLEQVPYVKSVKLPYGVSRREAASPRPEPEWVSCLKSVRLLYGYMSRRDILSVTPHKAAGRSVGYVKCGIPLRSANGMCTEGPDKPAAK